MSESKPKWTIDSFEPSEGRVIGGCQEDHTAWLRRSDRRFISLNIASIGISEDEARRMLQAMCDGMNNLAAG